MTTAPLITLDHVTVRLRDRRLLADTCWQIRCGENWVIWGPNGAGKSTLAQVLTGQATVVQGTVIRHYSHHADGNDGRPPAALVSSEQYHRLYQRENLLEQMRHFAGRVLETTLAAELLDNCDPTAGSVQTQPYRSKILACLGLGPLLTKPLTALSSGEMRKLLLGRALLTEARLLILDEPFNGLDAHSRRQLGRILIWLADEGRQMVLITHRLSEIPECFRNVLQLDRGRVVWQGSRCAFLTRVSPTASAASATPTECVPPLPVSGLNASSSALIRMRDVTVRFGDQLILDCVSWTVRPGEQWALIGPNGAGKSTLLQLITGDQLQAYANDIDLFGRPKGSGETVWEIKKNIGIVGDVLQARYQRDMTGFDVICSGFFDSVGLYRACSEEQRRQARQWVRSLKIADLSDQPMTRLSFGQQRLILVARALVKSPQVLILDEPCNGLDQDHRVRLLNLLDTLGRSGATHLLYVSHRPDEIPACITRRLYLDGGKIVDRYPQAGETRKHAAG